MFCRRCGAKIEIKAASSSSSHQEVDSLEAEIKRLRQEMEIERLKHQQEMERLDHEQEQRQRKAELEKERSKMEDEEFFSRYKVITTDDPDGIPIDDFLSGNFTSSKNEENPSHVKDFLQDLSDEEWRKDHPTTMLAIVIGIFILFLLSARFSN